ncbi:hypothetical protein A7K99_11215 [Tatumella citrea]|uniref:Uncharacterized protein n=1 Tax=Tatumella citrea TaxID=53336 RepID=A0A1Y0L8B8_TATCI|nr:hypothetical protein A7K98_11215 [Tatumella citrea]ARU98332.1 hypothetical protein A7K99_11215 [Tatumella citrea]
MFIRLILLCFLRVAEADSRVLSAFYADSDDRVSEIHLIAAGMRFIYIESCATILKQERDEWTTGRNCQT